ncbi:bZIP transcription factor [Chroogloeocystis siderophila]|uniref:Uncharacterized protein n=1 Tax=Chroogloeocystis siderophila 5.2 s.c.1 TaxID=247279 RepID=A0A1U7HL99_9CHRO|nr:bZIP transcription factor [Chroogloeocystis siderophila]OKH24331.1 hypothetical protein NIES1031_16240 [Chroogloeocystis siderophila 5.2 s.c.1]
MRSSTTPPPNSTSGRQYSPSVPLSVYKELVAQLQATEAKINLLSAENYALAKQNQQLRQEIETAVQSVIRLQQIVDGTPPYSPNYHVTRPASSSRSTQRRKKTVKPMTVPPKQTSTVGRLQTEQEDGKYRRRMSPTASEVNGWGLAIAILVIIVSAFGAGYLIVGPLRSNR